MGVMSKQGIVNNTKCFRMQWLINTNPAAQTRPVLDLSSFVPVPSLPRKRATILFLAFSLFELLASLSQCLFSESKKKNREVGEYTQYGKIF